MKIEIERRLNGSVLFVHECENNTIKLTLEAAVKIGARLDGANLVGARLVGANLVGANLVCANLVGARLDGANLVGANLDSANLYGANLDGARLVGATYGKAAFKKGFKQLLGSVWPIYFFDAHIKIGCKLYTTVEWENFTDDEISTMESRALEFWKENKEIILAIAHHHQK